MINTYDYTIKQLIVDEEYVFEVPNYQRRFVWTEKQIYQFLMDASFCLTKFIDSENKFIHYAGQMIFRQLADKFDGRKRLEIIDGQQRLTTFMLLVTAAIDLITQWNEQSPLPKILKERYLLSTFQSMCVDNEKKLKLSKYDFVFWNDLTDGAYADKKELNVTAKSQKNLWNAYQIIKNYLCKKLTQETEKKEETVFAYIEALAESFRVVILMTDNPGHEFALFQIVNNRGIPLTPGEMLKARTIELFSNQKHEPRRIRMVREAEEVWEDILSDPGEITIDYLKWNYTAMQGKQPGSLRKISLNELYEQDIFHCLNQREISMDLQDAILDQLKQLQENIQLCRFLRTGKFPVNNTSNTLNLLLTILICNMKNTACIPLYLKLLSENTEKKALSVAEKLTPMLFKTYFMAKHMGTINDESIIRVYQTIWENFDNNDYNLEKIKAHLEEILRKDKCKQEFFIKINQPVYSRGAGNMKAKILLLMAELQYLKENEQDSAEYGDDSVNFVFDKMSVEHLLPEGVSEESVSRNFYESMHNLGNLTLLGRKLNSREKNKPFIDKKPIYSKSPYSITREVGKLDDWLYTNYQHRQEELIQIVKRAFEL